MALFVRSLSASVVGLGIVVVPSAGSAAVATPFSFGFSIFSAAVGVVGVGSGITNIPAGGAAKRVGMGVGGTFVFIADPPGTAEYLSGTTIIDYPSQLVELAPVNPVIWFGEFSENPSLPSSSPPISTTGLFDTDWTVPIQGPNAALNVSVMEAPGQVSVSWNASPGVSVAMPGHVNIFGLLFDNISGRSLTLKPSKGSNPANTSPDINLTQVFAGQSLTCIPFDETVPVQCGDTETYGFRVAVPAPPVWSLTAGAALVVLTWGRRRQRT